MKKMLVIMAVVAIGASVAHAEIINWAGAGFIMDSSSVVATPGWRVELYQDVGNDNAGTWYNDFQVGTDGTLQGTGLGLNGTANDIMVGPNSWNSVFDFGGGFISLGFENATPTVAGGASYYSVVFKGASIATATHSYVLDSASFLVTVGSGIGTTAPDSYSVGLAAAAGQTNSVIPEPATFGLMGVAGLGMFLARKKARR